MLSTLIINETTSIAENCGQIYKNQKDTERRAASLKKIFFETENKLIKLNDKDTYDLAMRPDNKGRTIKWKSIDATLNKGFKAGLDEEKDQLPISDSEIMQLQDQEIGARFDGENYINIIKRKGSIISSFNRLRKKIYKLWNLPGTPVKTVDTNPPAKVTVLKSQKELQAGITLYFYSIQLL